MALTTLQKTQLNNMNAAAKSVTLTVTSATDFGAVEAGSVTVSLYYLV